MSIDLFIYSSLNADDMRIRLGALQEQHPEFFATKFSIRGLAEADEDDIQRGAEFNIQVRSFILIGLDDKSAVDDIDPLSSLLISEFGTGHLVVMLEDDTRLPLGD